MKIRTDFVTNSSSVSFIVTMHPSIIDGIIDSFKNVYDTGVKRVVKILHDDMLNNGTRVMLEGIELYSNYYKFDNGGDCMFADSYEKAYEDIDFSEMTDEDIWPLVLGEFIFQKKISETDGFGVIKI